jgi:hypothetical protein
MACMRATRQGRESTMTVLALADGMREWAYKQFRVALLVQVCQYCLFTSLCNFFLRVLQLEMGKKQCGPPNTWHCTSDNSTRGSLKSAGLGSMSCNRCSSLLPIGAGKMITCLHTLAAIDLQEQREHGLSGMPQGCNNMLNIRTTHM